jgi:hypothetical protein
MAKAIDEYEMKCDMVTEKKKKNVTMDLNCQGKKKVCAQLVVDSR